jgi:hypothetical protein
VLNTIIRPALLSLFLLVSSLPGEAAEVLECRITPAETKCTPYPVLIEGDLTVSADDGFRLEARYEACYHSEKISIGGKVERLLRDDDLSIELLATDIRQSAYPQQNFPRTVGTVILGTQNLEGYFFDVWATIRTHGTFHQEPYSRLVRCIGK